MPIVHLLESDPVFTPDGESAKTILDAQSATISQNSTKQSYKTAGSPNIQKIAVDALEDVVSITTLGFPFGDNALNRGDFGSLTVVMKARADGIGTTGAALTKTWTYAVVESITAGPTIDGSPSYSVNFACTPITNA